MRLPCHVRQERVRTRAGTPSLLPREQLDLHSSSTPHRADEIAPMSETAMHNLWHFVTPPLLHGTCAVRTKPRTWSAILRAPPAGHAGSPGTARMRVVGTKPRARSARTASPSEP
jgi:hypothetical protein